MSLELLKEMGEGIQTLDQRREAKRLVSKWGKTGLLKNLNEHKQAAMARLLENQAAQLLQEASNSSDISGFQNVAFPIVRRVFAGLIANELVSVQPMSLPSGLLFYLDYRFDQPTKAGNQLDQAKDFARGGSLFGDQTLPGTENLGTGGFYNIGSSFSQREKISSSTFTYSMRSATLSDIAWDMDLSSSLANLYVVDVSGVLPLTTDMAQAQFGKNEIKQWVPVSASSLSAPQAPAVSGVNNVGGTGATVAGAVTSSDGLPIRNLDWTVFRRHTVLNATGSSVISFLVGGNGQTTGVFAAPASTATGTVKLSFIVGTSISQVTDVNTRPAGVQTIDTYESDMNIAPTPPIPEIDFTIRSVAVTANSRKLKAKWTPELAQDLAAYQNLDAEVELTQVLSEAIALEIDREILGDLLANATGANFFWSRVPGRFVFKNTGTIVSPAPTFTGTVREWYETLIETIIDVANNIHRKTLRGAANFLVTSPDVATILEASVLYKPVLSMDPKETMFTVGTEKVGTLNNRFTVYKDPYFPRNKILVGYKGGSFLETGYVYAPYVPLIVTPTIYAPEDFTPRKGVMTRYAKKLVRSDFYGSVIVQDMNII